MGVEKTEHIAPLTLSSSGGHLYPILPWEQSKKRNIASGVYL